MKRMNKIAEMLFVCMLVLGIGAGVFSCPQSASAKSEYEKTYTYTASYVASNALVAKTKGSPVFKGTCCDVHHPVSPGKAKGDELSNSGRMARITYYYRDWLGDTSMPAKGHFSKSVVLKFMMQWEGSGKSDWISSGGYTKETVDAVEYYRKKALDNCAKAPENFVVLELKPTDGSQHFVVWHEFPQAKIRVTKTSTNTETLKDADYNLNGATIKVHQGSKKGPVVLNFVCSKDNKKKDGTYVSEYVTVQAKKTYWAEETKAGEKGYTRYTQWQSQTPKEGDKINFKIENPPNNSGVQVFKTTTLPDEEMNEYYNLGDIYIKIYKKNTSGTDELIATVKTDENGATEPVDVSPGTYYAVEDPADNPDIREKGWDVTAPIRSADVNVTDSLMPLYIENPAAKGSLTVQKVVDPPTEDANGFKFCAKNINTDESEPPFEAITGDKGAPTGVADFGELPFGIYDVWEELTQEQMDAGWSDVTIPKDGDPIRVEILPGDNKDVRIEDYENQKKPDEGNLETYKTIVDAEGNEIEGDKSGFKYNLTKTDEPNIGRVYTEYTKSDGKLLFEGVRVGTYKLKEELTQEQSERYKDLMGEVTNIQILANKTIDLSGATFQPGYAGTNPKNSLSGAYIHKQIVDSQGNPLDVDASGFNFIVKRKSDGAVVAKMGPTEANGCTKVYTIDPGTYVVTEEPREGYTDITESREITIANGETKKVEWENTKESHASIHKEIVDKDGDPMDVDASGFTFTIKKKSDGTVAGHMGPTDKKGNTTQYRIEPGTYIVTEDPREGYDDLMGPKEIVIAEGDEQTITWKNTPEEDIGEAYIEKQLTEDSASGGSKSGFKFKLTSTEDKSVSFELGPTGQDGLTETIKVPSGTYVLTEQEPLPAHYTDATGPQTVTVEKKKVNHFTHKNQYTEDGKARIKKVLSANSKPGGSAKGFYFVIKDKKTGKEVATLESKNAVDGGFTTDWKALPAGTYTVTEENSDSNYVSVTASPQEFTLEDGQEKTITWENRYDPSPAKIAISKRLSADSKDKEHATVVGFKFNVYKKLANGSRQFVRSETTKQEHVGADGVARIPAFEVDPGFTYEVEEELTAAQKEKYTDRSGTQSKTITEGETADFVFSNYHGSVETTATIRKVMTEDSSSGWTLKNFTFRMANTNGDPSMVYTLETDDDGYASVTDIPYGTYKITEVLSDGQKVNYTDVTEKKTITLSKDHPSETVEWENRYRKDGEIEIIKKLTEDSEEGGKVSGFQFHVVCKSDTTVAPRDVVTGIDGKIDVTGLKFGTYEITEVLTQEQQKRYTSATPNPQTVTVTKDHPFGEVTWENRFRDLGEMHLQKVIRSESPDVPLSGFKFIFKSTSASGKTYEKLTDADGKIDIYDVPYGTYRVSEQLTQEQQKYFTSLTPSPQELEVRADKPVASITWVNEHSDEGEIHLVKQMDEKSTSGWKLDGFKFNFTNKATGALYTSATTDRDGKIDLYHVPFGTYTITEEMTQNQAKYYTDLTVSREITLDKNTARETIQTPVSWIQHYEHDSYDIEIRKQVVGSEADPDDSFDFDIDLQNLEASEEGSGYVAPTYAVYQRASYGDQVKVVSYKESEVVSEDHMRLHLSMKDDQFIEITGLPSGATYTITEKKNDYVPSYTVTQLEGTVAKTSDTGKSNKDLSTGKGELKKVTGEKRVIYTFYNQVQTDPPTNEIQLSKMTTDGNTGTDFDYTVDLSGLSENTAYILMEEGNTAYSLSISSTGGRVTRSGSGVAGVPIRLSRSDGKAKLIRSDANGNLDLTDLTDWMQQKDGVITASFLNQTGSFRYGATSLTLNCSDYDIHSFTTGADGKGSVSCSLKSGEKAWVPALPEKSSYTVTEAGCDYIPSYVITRHLVQSGAAGQIDQDSGETDQSLTTEAQQFPKSAAATDVVDFTNTTDTTRLRVTKEVVDEDGDPLQDNTEFDYLVNITGLKRSSYLLVVPGDETITLSTTRSGNMQVTVVNSQLFAGGDLSGIPVRVIRPDGSSRTLYTDSNGTIPASAYTQWLKEGAGDDFEYTVEFMNRTAKGTFENTTP